MDWTQFLNLGVPAFILVVGGYAAGKFMAAEIKEWRLWYTTEYWPEHKSESQRNTELLVEMKSLMTQVSLNLNSVREDLQDLKSR